jgi:hypothetical protein
MPLPDPIETSYAALAVKSFVPVAATIASELEVLILSV